MRLLPSEKETRIQKAIQTFQDTGSLEIAEPCNCGTQIRHNNGGNYHETILLQEDQGQVYVKYETSCELVPAAEWDLCPDWDKVIKAHSDWL